MANWYVRKGGLDTNGGSSNSLTPEKSGTDGTVVGTSATFTSASGQFVAGDVDKGINIAGVIYRIATYTSATSITLDRTRAAGTSLAWSIGGATLTVNKLTNVPATTAVRAGDTIWIGAGTYRELLTMSQSYTVTPVVVCGDVDGVMTGDSGEIIMTAYLTNDKTAPSINPIIGSASTIRNFWTFRNITFIGGASNPSVMILGNANDISFINCAIISLYPANVGAITHTLTTATAKNILFDSCIMMIGSAYSITLPTVGTADYDANIVVRNCLWYCKGTFLDITASGALAFKGGGIYAYNNTVIAPGQPTIRTNSANVSITFPVRVENNVFVCGTGVTCLNANTLGQIVEDYNIITSGSTPRTNVTAGANSKSDGSYALNLHFGQERIWGGQLRPFGMPTAGSPILGYGNSATAGVPTTDILGVTRPAGGASALKAIGAYERNNTWSRETTTVRTGSTSLSITGPGYQDFMVPVDATSTTVSVYLRWDGTYTGTKPSLQIVNSTECGVANATATATGSSGVWEQVSLTFTPTKKGIISVRLLSSDTNGAGKVYADDFEVV